jgi:anti-anti-sigma factor
MTGLNAEGFHVSTSREGADVRIEVSGELDIFTSPTMDAAITEALTPTPACVRIDMAGVSFIDSSAIAVLVSSDRKAQEAGSRLVVCAPSDQVRRVLDLVGLTAHLNLEDR